MRPPRRWLAPGAGTAMPPPPRPSGGGARGPEGPPHSPPPLPLRPMSGRRQTEETAAPNPPRRGRCTRGAGAPRQGQAPARPARCRPMADRRRPGRRKLSEADPGKTGMRTRAGGFPPPSPPPLPHWPVGGRPDRARRPRPPGNPHGTSIPRRARRRQQMAGRRPMEQGGRRGGPPNPPPPPAPPPQFGSHRGGPPPPPEGTATRGGGGDAAGPAHCPPQRP